MLRLNTLTSRGAVYINAASYQKLLSSMSYSLLPSDVIDVDGEFLRGDIAVRLVQVDEHDPAILKSLGYLGLYVGKTLVNYSSREIAKIKGLDDHGIQKQLGYVGSGSVASGSTIHLLKTPVLRRVRISHLPTKVPEFELPHFGLKKCRNKHLVGILISPKK
jgi:glutamate 5-kinase